MPSIKHEGLEVFVYRGKDGSLVVEIVGPEDDDCDVNSSPAIRIWLNEAKIYDNTHLRNKKMLMK